MGTLSTYEDLIEALAAFVGREIVVTVRPYVPDEPRMPANIFGGILSHAGGHHPLFPSHPDMDLGPLGGEWASWCVVSWDTGRVVGLFRTGSAAFLGGEVEKGSGVITWRFGYLGLDSEPVLEVEVKIGSIPQSAADLDGLGPTDG